MNRYDVFAAYYMFSVLYNGDSYANTIGRRLARLGYRPSRSEEYLETLSPDVKAIYGALVRRRDGQQVAYFRLHKRAPEVFPSWPGSIHVGKPRQYVARLGLNPAALDCWQ